MLGRGTFGSVFEGGVLGCGRKVAVKRFHDGDHIGVLMLQLKRTLAALRAADSWVAAGCWVAPAAVAANKVWGGELLLMPLLRQQANDAPAEELTECLRAFCDELDRVGAVHVDLCRRNILWSGSAWQVADYDAAYVVADAPRLEPPRGTLCPYGVGHGNKIWRPPPRVGLQCASRLAQPCKGTSQRGGPLRANNCMRTTTRYSTWAYAPPELLREAADVLFSRAQAWQT